MDAHGVSARAASVARGPFSSLRPRLLAAGDDDDDVLTPRATFADEQVGPGGRVRVTGALEPICQENRGGAARIAVA